MHPFSTPWKRKGAEKGCIGNEWVKSGIAIPLDKF